MPGFVEVSRAVAYPWNCDQFGHMNVRFHVHLFDDAAFHLWTVHGMSLKSLQARGTHTVVARLTVNYHREVRAGDNLVIHGAFTRVGSKSVEHRLRMYDADSGELCAIQDAVEVFFDAATRRSAVIPAEVRRRLEALITDPEAPA